MEERRERRSKLFVQIPGIDKTIKLKKSKLLHKHENLFLDKFDSENEWEQEYFIIYNSYLLEDVDLKLDDFN